MRFSTHERVLDVRLSHIRNQSELENNRLALTKSILKKWDLRNPLQGRDVGTGSLGRQLGTDLQSQRNPVNRPDATW